MPEMPPMIRSGRKRIEVKREADQRRGSARERGYTTAWDKAAKGHLRNDPLCVYHRLGVWGDPPAVVAADMVDHLYPHNMDQAVFWDRKRWVSCCTPCHNGPKQRTERQGRAALDRLAALLGLG